MAKSAMAELQSPQGRLKSLMLADLASVVLLGEDALARGNAAAEVTTALSARDIVLGDEGVAAGLGTLVFRLLWISRRVPAKQLECQVLVLIALLLRQTLQPLKFHEGFRAVSPASVEQASDDHNAVDLFGGQLLLILNESHGGLHSCCILFLVELALAEKEEVNGLGALPRIGEGFVGTRADIRRDQRVHSLRGHVCRCLSPCTRYLSHLGIEHSLLVRIYFEGRQHIYLLD